MGSKRIGFFGAVTVAGLAICLTVSACGPQPGAETAGAGVTSTPAAEPTATVSASPSASPSAAPATAAAPSPEVPAQPDEPTQPALTSFTFPDGHISFTYPADWTVRTQRGPGREGPPWQPVEAVVANGAGEDLFRVSSGADGIGCTAGPTTRTVLDKAAVPGMREADGTTPMFGFAIESSGGDDSYRMMVSHPRYLQEGETSSGCSMLVMENGAALNEVIFNQPAFPNREAAEAWMATEQYAQLKALMMSLTYS